MFASVGSPAVAFFLEIVVAGEERAWFVFLGIGMSEEAGGFVEDEAVNF